jgi:hypothetical protein
MYMKKSFSGFSDKSPSLLAVVHVAAAAAAVLVFPSYPAFPYCHWMALAHVLYQLVVGVKRLAAYRAGQQDSEFLQRPMIN